MCTDNMPSGTALKLGDVITIRGGTHGRGPQHRRRGPARDGRRARARRRGAARRDRRHRDADRRRRCARSGPWIAGVVRQRRGAGRPGPRGRRADRRADLAAPARAPLPPRSSTPTSPTSRTWAAPNAGAITAALFLEEFVDGLPWAHIDIAGTAQADPVESWRTKGCTGIRRPTAGRAGARLPRDQPDRRRRTRGSDRSDARER